MPYHAARGGGGVAGARRISVVVVRPAGAPVLQLAGPPQPPEIGVCVLGWVRSGALVVSPSLVPVVSPLDSSALGWPRRRRVVLRGPWCWMGWSRGCPPWPPRRGCAQVLGADRHLKPCQPSVMAGLAAVADPSVRPEAVLAWRQTVRATAVRFGVPGENTRTARARHRVLGPTFSGHPPQD